MSDKLSQAGELVALASSWYRFGQGMDGEPFAVALAGPGIARMLRGGRSSLRAELAATYNIAHHRVPSAQALADALAVLEGQALTSAREPIALRVATSADAAYYLDLGDSAGRAVRIDCNGWTVVTQPDVLFRRSELTGALPEPVAGDVDAFLDLLNVTTDDRPAVLAWLVAVILGVPVPILFVRGPAGAAKSSGSRLIVRVLDPSPAPLRAAPRDLEGWAIAAAGSVVVGLDNLTTIPDWFSDALCRAVTGEAIVRRALYTDAGLSVVAFRRAVVLTAIDAGALRGDLADRLLTLDLPEIGERDRRDDSDVEAAFLAAWPGTLGGLLDLTAAVVRILPAVHLARRPRMADFGRILAAVDAIRGTDGLTRYLDQRMDLAREAAEGDVIGAAVIEWMAQRDTWTGTAGELLSELEPDKRAPKGWPATARGLAGALRRLVAPLRSAGIVVTFDREDGGNRRRLVTLVRDGRDGRDGASPALSNDGLGTVGTVGGDSPSVGSEEEVENGTDAREYRGTTVPNVPTVPRSSRAPLNLIMDLDTALGSRPPRTCPSCQGSHPAGMTCIEATA